MQQSLISQYFVSNYTKCSKEDEFLSSWESLAYISHAFSIVLLPLYLFGAYCIIYKTPVTMSFFKWPLINLHFWSCFVDILLCSLITPYLFFPSVSGFPVGLFRFIGIPTAVQIWMGIVSIFFMIMSMCILFENRHNSIPVNKFRITRRTTKVLYYGLRILGLLIYSFAIFAYMPDQEVGKLEILKLVPCPTKEFFHSPVFVLCTDKNYIHFLAAITALGVSFEMAQMAFFIFCCLYYLLYCLNGFTSRKTQKMQISFFISVATQVAIPTIFLLPTFIYLTLSVIFNYYNQSLTNFCILYSSTHGFLSTIVVLAIHKPYRSFILTRIGKRPPSVSIHMTRKSIDVRKISVQQLQVFF